MRKCTSFIWMQCSKYDAEIYGSCSLILEEKTQPKPEAEVD